MAALLDVETPVPGVTQGDSRPDLQSVAVLTTTDAHAPDFTVSAGWGHFGVGSAVMPGRGRAVSSPPRHAATKLLVAAEMLVEKEAGGEDALGGEDEAVDIYLSATTFWQHVPVAVWEYTLGGYQVLKKWLSYREIGVLGRPLRAEEAREFMHIARRIAALLVLNPALDANYQAQQLP